MPLSTSDQLLSRVNVSGTYSGSELQAAEESALTRLAFYKANNDARKVLRYEDLIMKSRSVMETVPTNAGTNKVRFWETETLGADSPNPTGSGKFAELDGNPAKAYKREPQEVALVEYSGSRKASTKRERETIFNEKMTMNDSLANSWQLTINNVIRNALLKSTSDTNGRKNGGTLYAKKRASASAVTSNDGIDAELIKTAESTMLENRSGMVTPEMFSTPQVSTEGMKPGWIFITGLDGKEDVEAINGYLPRERYPGNGMAAIHPLEYGYYKGFRFILDLNMNNLGAMGQGSPKANLMNAIILGEEAFMFASFQGMYYNLMVNEGPSKADEYDMWFSLALKYEVGASVLRSESVLAVVHAGSK